MKFNQSGLPDPISIRTPSWRYKSSFQEQKITKSIGIDSNFKLQRKQPLQNQPTNKQNPNKSHIQQKIKPPKFKFTKNFQTAQKIPHEAVIVIPFDKQRHLKGKIFASLKNSSTLALAP